MDIKLIDIILYGLIYFISAFSSGFIFYKTIFLKFIIPLGNTSDDSPNKKRSRVYKYFKITPINKICQKCNKEFEHQLLQLI
jgi:hypothetical protein